MGSVVPLFRLERIGRIDTHRSSAGEITRHERDAREEHHDDCEGARIGRTNVEQERREHACERQRADNTEHDADGHERHRLIEHEAEHVTGLSAAVTEIFPKRVQLLRELVPRAGRIGALFNMSNPALPPQWREVETAARSLGLEPILLDVRRPEDLAPACDSAVRQRVDALIVGLDTLTQANQQLIVDLAARRRLPAIYASMEFVGGLAIYGVNYPEMYRQAASFAHKIFKGAKPADLPVEEPTKVELVINLRTAKALGLTVSQSVLFRADQVIE